jgi:two-component system NtrC family response regulator
LLAALFLKRALPRKRTRLTGDAAAWLAAQPWPGNVRELQSLIDCAAALAEPDAEGEIAVDLGLLAFARGDAAPAVPSARKGLDDEIAILETRMISAVLAETQGNRSETARLLGISRVGLLKKMDRLGLR